MPVSSGVMIIYLEKSSGSCPLAFVWVYFLLPCQWPVLIHDYTKLLTYSLVIIKTCYVHWPTLNDLLSFCNTSTLHCFQPTYYCSSSFRTKLFYLYVTLWHYGTYFFFTLSTVSNSHLYFFSMHRPLPSLLISS